MSARGEGQAGELRGRISASGLTIQAAFASPLKRSRQTLEIVLAALPSPPPVVVEEDLTERSYGLVTGAKKSLVKSIVGTTTYGKWKRGLSDRPPFGESFSALIERTKVFAAHATEVYSGDTNAIVCSHSNTIRAVLLNLGVMDYDEAISVPIRNCEPMCFMSSGSNLQLVSRV